MKKWIAFACLLILSAGLLIACGDRHKTHTTVHHPAVAATCGADGTAEYWSCEGCERLFADAEATSEITDPATLTLPATGKHAYNAQYVCETCGYTSAASDGLIYVLNSEGTAYTVAGAAPTVTALVIPAQHQQLPVTAIAAHAFKNYDKLLAVTIPAGVSSIGDGAFAGCSALSAVHITDVAAWCGIEFANSASNPLIYAKKLYLNGTLAETLTVPDGVTRIADYAFYNCQSLKRVTLPAGLTSIGTAAFYACSYMTDCALPAALASIGDTAFYFCRSLTEVSIPVGVTVIGAGAFQYCTGITSARFAVTEGWSVLPDAVTVPSADLADATTASTCLHTTYVEKTWQRAAQ